MKIIFSDHALERMEERGIGRDLIKQAIKKPDKIEKSFSFASRFLIKKLYFNEKLKRDHLLLVIFETKADIIEIITIIDTSKISKHF